MGVKGDMGEKGEMGLPGETGLPGLKGAPVRFKKLLLKETADVTLKGVTGYVWKLSRVRNIVDNILIFRVPLIHIKRFYDV